MKYFDQLFKGVIMLMIPLFSLSSAQAQFRVIGYLPNWGSFLTNANAIDYSKITHLNIAFINPTNVNGNMGPTNDLANVVTLAHNNNVKVLASLGGATATSLYTTLLSTSATRTAFIDKITQFTLTYNLDGIDVDLEGNSVDGNYEAFVTELKDSMVAHDKLTTAAVATWYSNRITNNALAQFDFINIMTYDATGTWAPNTPGQHASYDFAVNDLIFWGNRGVSKDKMCLGVPFYGYAFITGTFSFGWSEVVSAFPQNIYNDEIYPTSGGGRFYNGIITIQRKTKLALEEAGGIMIWQLVFDTQNSTSLLSAIDAIIQDNGENTPPTTSITSPATLSNFEENADITITADANDTDGEIIKVEFYAGNFKIGEDYTAPYSIVWNNGGAKSYNITSVAYDNLSSFTTSSPISITITDINEPAVYGGTRWTIPGKIEVEDFNWGPNNTSYYDLSAGNNGEKYRSTDVDIEHCLDIHGGYNIAWTSAGEWLEYDVNITEDNNYTLESRVATNANGTRTFHIEIDGQNVSGTISTTKTNGWQTWTSLNTTGIPLTQGEKKMRIVFDNGDLNINFVRFSISLGTSTTESTALDHAMTVYPNPCNDFITLEYYKEDHSPVEITIVDQFNRELILLNNTSGNTGKQSQQISTQNLSSGLYFCKIKSTSGIRSIKIIKE